jgi:hypothetical protein
MLRSGPMAATISFARDSTIFQIRTWEANCTIIAEPVVGRLHRVYSRAA